MIVGKKAEESWYFLGMCVCAFVLEIAETTGLSPGGTIWRPSPKYFFWVWQSMKNPSQEDLPKKV